MKITLPTFNFVSVYHVGSLNIADKGIQFPSSLEGSCLSVSHCPASWQKIAKLGGNPWWELSADSILMLDALRLKKSGKDVIAQAGVEDGLLRRQVVYCAPHLDEDGSVCGYSSHLTMDEAIAEVQSTFFDETASDLKKKVKQKEAFLATDLLAKWSGWKHTADAFDIYLPFFVEKYAPTLMGVWWTEALDTHSLSAPRGAVLPSKIKQLRKRQIPEEQQWSWSTEKPTISSLSRGQIEVALSLKSLKVA